MDAFEAQTAYHSIRARFDARQIPVDDHNLKVHELRYQDNTGIWWTISPADGSWLRWNGTSWEPAFTHREPVSGVIKPAQHGVHESQPSWYIPPSGKTPEPVPAPLSSWEAHTLEPDGSHLPEVRQRWSNGKMFAFGSIACGTLAFVIFPYIIGFAGIALGLLSVKEKYTSGAIGILISAAVIPITYFMSLHLELLL
jgi:hypothetical protein